VKVASSAKEYRQAFKLRFDVFYTEMQNLDEGLAGFDCDVYDQIGDLLIIKDDDKDEVIGTYRIISGQYASQFYSQTEFDLSLFLDSTDSVMEVSRACVHKDYRSGVTLSLLWQGLMEYAKNTESRYLFGCSSVWTSEVGVAAKVLNHFEDANVVEKNYDIKPLAKYHRSVKDTCPTDIDANDYISPLLKTYLRAGAVLFGEPAYDAEFCCFDFFTVLDLDKLRDKYRRKYC
jgi:putative hemolysin